MITSTRLRGYLTSNRRLGRIHTRLALVGWGSADRLGEAITMASGWRKSTLSPIYACVASFLFVFLLGVGFKKEHEPVLTSPSTVPAAQQVVIRVKLDRRGDQGDQGPATGVEGVRIWQENLKKEIGEGRLVEGIWSYQPTDTKKFKVCLTLKQGWLVTSPKTTLKDEDTNTSCTNDPIDGQKPIEFVLGGGG
jgi:hypothetical protein